MSNVMPPSLSGMVESGFQSVLQAFHRRCRAGRLLAGILRAAIFAVLTLLVFGLLDYFSVFSDPARLVISRLLVFVLVTGVVSTLWRALLFGSREAAAEADNQLGDSRRTVLSAWELTHAENTPKGGLSAWLHQRAQGVARERMGTFGWSHALPRREIAATAKIAVLLLILLIALASTASAPFWTISQRLLFPHRDIPPYSPLQFTLAPRPADVLYGDNLVVSADISGGKIIGPVRCLTRDPGTNVISESPAFQESPTRYSRKLEKVAASLDVAFAVGRARSSWLPVTALMQPKVQEVLITIEPPPYTKMPKREFAVGTQELSPLPGSRISAVLSSNRPLAGGAMRIEAMGQGSQAQTAPGEVLDAHRARFSWIAREPSRLVFEVKDILGTASAPMQVEQKITPDERPKVSLRQPAGEILATPETELPVEGSAADDLGLSKVTFVRQLVGFRERSAPQSISPGERRYEFTNTLKLASYGLIPGQTIELAMEAGDTNPNLLGVSISESARIHIIARDQYAQLLRDQATLEDFTGRYEALRDALDQAREALKEMEKAAQSGDATLSEAARKKAEEAHQKAGQVFGELAKDFPLFDLDEALSKTAGAAMQQLFDNAKQLQQLSNAGPGALLEALPELRERLGAGEQELANEMKQGDRATAAANVFEQAGKFRETLEAQRQLTKDYNRTLEQIRRGETQASQALRDLARTQRAVSDDLRKLENELEGALNTLPDEFEKMQTEGREFVAGLRELKVESTMDEGAVAAEAGDGQTGGARAGEALAQLEALLRRKNGFSSMARGEEDTGFPWPQDLSKTLQQLMRSLIAKRGGQKGEGEEPGQGTSGQGGFGGLSDSGFAMRGKMPQLPIYGPSRMRFSQKAGAQLGGGERGGSGSGARPPEEGADVGENKLSAKYHDKAAGEGVALESVPEVYREALKRYFSADDSSAAASGPGAKRQ